MLSSRVLLILLSAYALHAGEPGFNGQPGSDLIITFNQALKDPQFNADFKALLKMLKKGVVQKNVQAFLRWSHWRCDEDGQLSAHQGQKSP